MLVDIHDISSSGAGVGRHKGKVVFVPGALIGERVSCTVEKEGSSIVQARLDQIEISSEDRCAPVCPHFKKCGGCQLQHLNYQGQLTFKQKRVQDCLTRIGKLEDITVNPVKASPPLYYRNKLQVPVQNGKIGFFGANTHEFVPIDHCYLHMQSSQTILEKIESLGIPYEVNTLTLKTAFSSGSIMVIFSSFSPLSQELVDYSHLLMKEINQIQSVYFTQRKKDANFVYGDHFKLVCGVEFIEDKILDLNFSLTKDAFFQVNSFQVAGLYQYALDGLHLNPEDVFLDAFCGVGTMTLLAAKKVQHAIGIECVKSSIDSAIKNQKNNNITNASFFLAKAEDKIKDLQRVDKAVINPPRKGCEKSFLEALMKLDVARIAYVSCDPATLARDCQILSSHYKLVSVQPFDLFPQTVHVETVAHFAKI